MNLPFPVGVPGKCVSRQRLSGAPGSLEASWLPLQCWVYAACLCALQALKRKPDLFLCSTLDVKAVFECGEYHGTGTHSRWLWREASLLLLRSCRADLGWRAVFLTADPSGLCPQVSCRSSSPRPRRSKHPVAFL